MDFLKKKKSYILASLLFLHGLVSFFVGDQSFGELMAGSSQLMEMFSGGVLAAGRAAISNG